MGFIDWQEEPVHRRKITAALRRVGLRPDLEEDWEVHGPHAPEMNCQVYVGYAIRP